MEEYRYLSLVTSRMLYRLGRYEDVLDSGREVDKLSTGFDLKLVMAMSYAKMGDVEKGKHILDVRPCRVTRGRGDLALWGPVEIDGKE